MTEKLMTVSDYCKYRDITRGAFYRHRREGKLNGCFRRKPGGAREYVIVSKADKALDAKIAPMQQIGGQANKAKHQKQDDQDLYSEAEVLLHALNHACDLFGVQWRSYKPDGEYYTGTEAKAAAEETQRNLLAFMAATEEEQGTGKGFLNSAAWTLAALMPEGEFNLEAVQNSRAKGCLEMVKTELSKTKGD